MPCDPNTGLVVHDPARSGGELSVPEDQRPLAHVIDELQVHLDTLDAKKLSVEWRFSSRPHATRLQLVEHDTPTSHLAIYVESASEAQVMLCTLDNPANPHRGQRLMIGHWTVSNDFARPCAGVYGLSSPRAWTRDLESEVVSRVLRLLLDALRDRYADSL